MPDPIQDKAYDWDRQDTPGERTSYISIYAQIDYLASKLFNDYEPTLGSEHDDFIDRLGFWINNVQDEEHQKLLLKLVPSLSFFGQNELYSLYRVAYNWNVASWLIDLNNLKLDSVNIKNKLTKALNHTWFCPITDSMKINSFYHVNNITPRFEFRPDWKGLNKFASEKKVREYIKKKDIKYLVLLEDFVGSGTQMKSAVEFALKFKSEINVLTIPLIVCPDGVREGLKLKKNNSRLDFAPVLELPQSMFVRKTPATSENYIVPLMRALVNDLYTKDKGILKSYVGKPYNPFGFKGTGGLVVMHTNCPNNSLPLLHQKYNNAWEPLFPRSERMKA